MSSNNSDNQPTETNTEETSDITNMALNNKLFYPITFPITTGAGTISVLFTLGAHGFNTNITTYFINTSAILTAIIIMCILVIIFYMNTKIILSYLKSSTQEIINRLMAFLLFCVGLQIASSGIISLFHIA